MWGSSALSVQTGILFWISLQAPQGRSRLCQGKGGRTTREPRGDLMPQLGDLTESTPPSTKAQGCATLPQGVPCFSHRSSRNQRPRQTSEAHVVRSESRGQGSTRSEGEEGA